MTTTQPYQQPRVTGKCPLCGDRLYAIPTFHGARLYSSEPLCGWCRLQAALATPPGKPAQSAEPPKNQAGASARQSTLPHVQRSPDDRRYPTPPYDR